MSKKETTKNQMSEDRLVTGLGVGELSELFRAAGDQIKIVSGTRLSKLNGGEEAVVFDRSPDSSKSRLRYVYRGKDSQKIRSEMFVIEMSVTSGADGRSRCQVVTTSAQVRDNKKLLKEDDHQRVRAALLQSDPTAVFELVRSV